MSQALQLPETFSDIEFDNQNQRPSKYTNDQKLSTVLVYMTYGNITKTAKAVNIPNRTIQDWVKTEWWAKLVTRIREEKKEEFEIGFTRLIDKSMNNIEKKLDTGEVSARDSATILGIIFDKRQVLTNQPTSITKSLNVNDMHEQFQRFMDAKQIESDVIERD